MLQYREVIKYSVWQLRKYPICKKPLLSKYTFLTANHTERQTFFVLPYSTKDEWLFNVVIAVRAKIAIKFEYISRRECKV